ncbi:hypothetical protein ACJRO7_026117 [Eucalyptus globulus]|uniref:BTB domain-containing protein n=1 Tax=Eucalyptus globulus TaxID=34317 RepID=A0ABD3KDZ9_EUCGL
MQRPCEEEETNSMPCTCTSCKEEHVTLDAVTWKECSDEARQTNEELKREIEDGTCKGCSEEAEQTKETKEELKGEIEDLKAKVAFLSINHLHLSGRPHGPGSTDVVLVAAGDSPNGGPSKPVPAHRAILISGMSYHIFRAFVIFLYAEACLNEQMACELLASAEKYQVEHLKAYHEKFLISKLNWDNSIRYYAFAHQHNAKEAATSLILDNLDKLRKHQVYFILTENPRLGLELLEASCLARWEKNAAPEDTSAK